MGQKVNPKGMRVGIIKGWDSVWYAEKDFKKFLYEDYQIRKYLKEKLFAAGIDKIEIERTNSRLRVAIHAAKPGQVIGRSGQEVEVLRKQLEKMAGVKVAIDIKEIKRPELSAQLVAEKVAA
ncbi:MAG: 30S ribosomal protein S3, partial [Clostridiales bacterium]|nr:30S ribosomal protein S3 [Clostridiales bacterium]